MSEDFWAFETSVVLENFHKKIEVLEVIGNQLLAGLGDGSLVVLEPGKGGDGTQWQVSKALKSFGQRRIVQLQVSSSSTAPSLNPQAKLYTLMPTPLSDAPCIWNRQQWQHVITRTQTCL